MPWLRPRSAMELKYLANKMPGIPTVEEASFRINLINMLECVLVSYYELIPV